MRVVLSLLLITFSTMSLYAQKSTFSVEIKERYESFNGFNKKTYGDSSLDKSGKELGSADDQLLVQRVLFGFTHESSKDTTWTLMGYDARVFGWSLNNENFIKNSGTDEAYTMNPYEDHFELFTAKVDIKNLFSKHLSLSLGRQKLHYGDKRIFGPGSWGNSVGWLWDAAKFSYKQNDNFIDLFYGQTKDKDPESFSITNKHVYEGLGFYSHVMISKHGAIEPFYVNKKSLRPVVSGTSKLHENSDHFGIRWFDSDIHNWSYDMTYTTMKGTNGTKKIDAYAYVIKGGYSFKKAQMKPKVEIGRVFASGDDDTTDAIQTNYTRPFGGTDGSLYGRMDMMFWSNHIDHQLALTLKPVSNTKLRLEFHDFKLDTPNDTWSYYKYSNISGNKDTDLGREYDIIIKYDYSKSLEFQAIFGYFDAGSFIVNNVENNDATRLFLQMKYSFSKSSR